MCWYFGGRCKAEEWMEDGFGVLIVVRRGGDIVLGMLDDVGFGSVFGFVEAILPLLDRGSVAKGIEVPLCQYRLHL